MSSGPDLAEILRKINDGICVLAADRQVSFKNERAAEILGCADEIFEKKIRETIEQRAPTRFEQFHAPLNRWFEHRAYPNADGGLTLVSCEITSRHRLEEALRASEERFRRLIDSNIIGVIVVENGLITEANDVFLSMVSFSRAELVAKQLRWRELTPDAFDALDMKARGELESKGVFSPYEKEFLRKDGSRVPVLIGGVALPSDAGAHETLCLALDLSIRRRAEERLRYIAEVGKILASSLECDKTLPELAEFIASNFADSCAIFILENGSRLRMANQDWSSLLTNADFELAVNQVLEGGEPVVMLAPCSRVLVPIITRGQIAGVLAMAAAKPRAFDVEDVRLLELFGRRIGIALDNARLYHETQTANRLKDEFVAVVSHELRTPLTPILGGVYMMQQEPHDETVVRRALELIERNAKTQLRIVDDLLDVSRAVSGKLRLLMEPVDVAVVINSAVEAVRSVSAAKQIQIDVRIGSNDCLVTGDADRLQQVVWNLLANSVKFTPNGGRVTIELAGTEHHVDIRVSDTGIGIEPQFLPHVFEKFSQADASRTRVHGGLGLGLAIVRQLVELHGGTVQAYSNEEAQGATFIVQLPLRNKAQAHTVTV
jgi:PAS domain S-box-containing protein